MAWTAPRTWVAGETVTAAIMNTHIRDNLNAIGAAWTSYTPAWTGTVTNPAIGNGTLSGHVAAAGKSTLFHIVVTMGSTTTFGSGDWLISLPVAPSTNARWSFVGELLDSGVANRPFRAVYNGAALQMLTPGTTAGGADRAVTPTVPFTWGAGDAFTVIGSYQAA